MCMGGQTPSAPVNPATPNPYAELQVKEAGGSSKPGDQSATASPPAGAAPSTVTDTGANFNNLKM